MVQNNEHMFNIMNITPATLKAFVILARNPQRRFYIREMAREAGSSAGGAHRALHTLNDAGLA